MISRRIKLTAFSSICHKIYQLLEIQTELTSLSRSKTNEAWRECEKGGAWYELLFSATLFTIGIVDIK